MHALRGVVSFAILFCYTLVGCVTVYVLALAQFLCPVPSWRKQIRGANDGVVTAWVFLNEKMCQLLRWIRIELTLPDTLPTRKEWWIIASNHQSWADIVILEIVFRTLAPPIKFFTKRELIWVPFLGFGLWLLRFPYVRRGKREKGQSRQQAQQKNRQELKRAAQQFHERPISLLLFLEGTRYTPIKHTQQRPLYQHLLRPKLGGLAFSLEALDGEVDRIVNVTVNYEGAVPGFWQFLCGRCRQVTVRVETIPLTASFNQNLKKEVLKLWERKDRVLTTMRS
ncbi:MAG: hypothetical protein F4W92_10075 [Gammaproteobacteria bacterium]|nr:hypothetical protein [Gammaproteobacteria bacterium]